MRKHVSKLQKEYEVRTANDVQEKLPTKLQKALNVCSEKGASSWLSAPPISDHGFALHKGPLGMPCACDMAGDQYVYPLIMPVTSNSPLSMH